MFDQRQIQLHVIIRTGQILRCHSSLTLTRIQSFYLRASQHLFALEATLLDFPGIFVPIDRWIFGIIASNEMSEVFNNALELDDLFMHESTLPIMTKFLALISTSLASNHLSELVR